ncbi:MAG: hypothetical protein GF411_02685 [Candidatus Lokiarchaeota archaeon]|nr:hypothetical protein [Candidatus Lokiarchaeota archaeon]
MSETQIGMELSGSGTLFSSARYQPEAMERFVIRFMAVLDFCLVLSFNILCEGLQLEVIEKSLVEFQDGLNPSFVPMFSRLIREFE